MKSRIELAKGLGATHGYDTTGVEDLVAGFKEVSGGNGPTVVIDSKSSNAPAYLPILTFHTATGYLPLLESGYKSVAPRGKFVFIGASIDPNYFLNISITAHMMNGTQLFGCCEGDSVPQEVIKMLLSWVEYTADCVTVHSEIGQILSRRPAADRQDYQIL